MKLLSHIQDNGVIVIECNEENIDGSNVRDFRDAIQKIMKDQTKVVLDMSHLKFVDSSGLGALIACLRQASSNKGDFRLCAISRSVLALFELMRMQRVFSIHSTVESAVNSFN